MTVNKVLVVICVLINLNYVQCSSLNLAKELQDKVNTKSLSLSPKCSEFYNYSNLSDSQYWSLYLKLFDSSSKIPTGLITRNAYDIGNFDECYGLTGELNGTTVKGKYCMGTIPLTINLNYKMMFNSLVDNITPIPRVLGKDQPMGIHFAYCTPNFCTAEDLEKILGIFPILSVTKFSEEYCYSKDSEADLGTGGILTISLLAIFGALLIASTTYDITLYYTDKKPHHEVLLAFSALSNGRKLFQSTNNPDQLLCLNGLRAISMMWVILGHEYSLTVNAAINNYGDVYRLTSAKKNMWLLNAPLSVDSFFTVGGLVTMYTFLKACDKGVKFNIPMYYLHRYLRLTPALAIMVLVHANLLIHMGNGPFWSNVYETYSSVCNKYWWSTILYIQNYVNPTETCVPQSWYLSVDMQLFILSPLILLPSKTWPKSKNVILMVLIVLGIIIPFSVTYWKKLNAISTIKNMGDAAAYQKYYYSQTYARFGPYIIGLLFGSIIYQNKKIGIKLTKNSKNISIALVIWLLILTGMVSCIYASAVTLDGDYNRLSNSFINGLNRSAWSLGLCLIILMCVFGYGGPIDQFLSLPIFQFLNKLSYTMYIVHLSIMGLRWSALRTPVHYSHLFVMHIYWADFMTTLAISLIYCISFESPVIILEKYIFSGSNGKSKKAINN